MARLVAATLALLVGMTLAAAPAAAAPAATLGRPTLAAAAKAQVAAVPAAALAQTAAAPAQAPTSEAAGKPFFKTGKGALAGVLIVGILGYTVYSFSNDRVKSPIR